jgi:hypothetical protein
VAADQRTSSDPITPPKGILTHLTVELPDITLTLRRLAEARAPESMRFEMHDMLIAFVKDPDGYHAELVGRP